MSQQDISQILEEAKKRWLRPGEVCEIIRNYQRFHLRPDPPYKPSGGSLFLFDRKTLRYFRKDGHRWRKKKDGKTVREAHEKLKSGSVDVLHCYYAHGEDNENFQRRSYWMLDGQLEHIVLVHYREVNEGGTPEITDLISPDSDFHSRSRGHLVAGQPSDGSSPSAVAWRKHAPSSELDDVDSGKGFNGLPSVEPDAGYGLGTAWLDEDVTFAFSAPTSRLDTGLWNSFSFSADDAVSGGNVARIDEGQKQTDFLNFGECREEGQAVAVCRASTLRDADDVLPGRFDHEDEGTFPVVVCSQKENSRFAGLLPCKDEDEDEDFSWRFGGKQEGGLKREDDGFWQWMSGEMGQVCDVSLTAAKDSDNCCWNNSMDDQKDEDTEISSLSRELHLDFCSPGPWLSQDQLFSVVDYSPDWAYSGGPETKVLIAGSFLGEAQCTEVRWSCMFGEVEVPAEVLSGNALRCYAPSLPPGRVPFYVSRSNRLACSEIREFEYRDASLYTSTFRGSEEEERVNLQTRLAKIVFSVCPSKCAAVEGYSSNSGDAFQDFHADEDDPKDTLIQTLLESRIRRWLLSQSREEGKGARVLDERGQGAIHLAAALGYDWAVKSIVAAAGVSPNFRDARGWTPLHWAAYSGRESTVVTLVTLGSSPSAVADPTAKEPQGRTAADVASTRGHKGIAGYLAEADLTSQLSSLDLQRSVVDCISGQSVLGDDCGDHLGVWETLAAVRTSTEAAARIRSALGGAPLHRRHRRSRGGASDEVLVCINDALLRVSAAERIQHKYRGWSGRREFLKLRHKIVKIQAHVRGHQVRRRYKKFVWSVGIVEKAILRWRRGRSGLRGFRGVDAGEEYDFLLEARMQKAVGVERALARVRSMARRPDGQMQYLRMVAATRLRSESLD